MVQMKFAEKSKTHILYSTTFFRKLCLLWDNVKKYCRGGERTRLVGRIIKATHTQSEYVILIAFQLQSDFAKAPQCYVIRTLSSLVLTSVKLTIRCFWSLTPCIGWSVPDISSKVLVSVAGVKGLFGCYDTSTLRLDFASKHRRQMSD